MSRKVIRGPIDIKVKLPKSYVCYSLLSVGCRALYMSNPLTRAFFIGRATANLLAEKAEAVVTDIAGEIGKNFAEAQKQWEEFGQDVAARAAAEEAHAAGDVGGESTSGAGTNFSTQPSDLQATLDDLRAEVAELRSQLQKYRSESA